MKSTNVIIYILTALVAASSVPAQQPCQLTIARLRYGGGGDWYTGPSMLPNLVKGAKERTALPLCDSTTTVQISDQGLFHFPFLFMTGHGDVRFTAQEKLRLRKFLIGGGFLWADDNYGMDKSFRREMAALFPENPLTPIPSTHPIFNSKYKLPGLPKIHEHDGEPAQAFGIFFEGRLILLYTHSADIGNALEDQHIHKLDDNRREAGLQMGVNVLSWFFSP
ncbi:MAG: DUF4159 domain-containing protein [Chitinispirillia bacterium]|nr:DUF4159 domain-containing protein [Chitinispirillia bacterium]MCL2242121.1 DUF4159 domain-containing protein [Chitinispirillia bacterium]